MPSSLETLASNTLVNTDKISAATENVAAATGGDGLAIAMVAGVAALIVMAVLMPIFVFGIYRRANEINKHTSRMLSEIQSLNLALGRMAMPAATQASAISSNLLVEPSTTDHDQEPFVVDRDPGAPLHGWQTLDESKRA